MTFCRFSLTFCSKITTYCSQNSSQGAHIESRLVKNLTLPQIKLSNFGLCALECTRISLEGISDVATFIMVKLENGAAHVPFLDYIQPYFAQRDIDIDSSRFKVNVHRYGTGWAQDYCCIGADLRFRYQAS